MEIGDDERYQRDYLYRRGGIPKGGAGHHVEHMYLLSGSLLTFLVSFLDLPSSLLFYEKEKKPFSVFQGFQQVLFQHTVSLQRNLFPRYCVGFHWAFTSLGVDGRSNS
jgi:hypothetical protein